MRRLKGGNEGRPQRKLSDKTLKVTGARDSQERICEKTVKARSEGGLFKDASPLRGRIKPALSEVEGVGVTQTKGGEE